MYRENMKKIITDDVQTNIFEGINGIGIYTETQFLFFTKAVD